MPTAPRKPDSSDEFPMGWFLVVSSVAAVFFVRAYSWKFGHWFEPLLLSVLLGWLVANLIHLQRRWLRDHKFRTGERREEKQ
jgi:hypothetical protein